MKKNSCPKDCPDRCADPNCHITCKRYLDFVKENEEDKALIRKKKKVNNIYWEYAKESTSKMKKRGVTIVAERRKKGIDFKKNKEN